jgi:hypothetical protein
MIPEARCNSKPRSSRDLIGDITFGFEPCASEATVIWDWRRFVGGDGLLISSAFLSITDSRRWVGATSFEGGTLEPVLVSSGTEGLTGKGRIKGLGRCEDGVPPAASSISFERPLIEGSWPRPETGLDLDSRSGGGSRQVAVPIGTSILEASDSASGMGGVVRVDMGPCCRGSFAVLTKEIDSAEKLLELRLVRSIVGGAETILSRLTAVGTGGTTGTAGTFCIDRRREPLPKLGVLLNDFNVGVTGDSESMKLSFRGEGGEEEHTEVAAVTTSSSDVREVLVEALENRDVSLSGSSRKRSGDSPEDVAIEVPVELTRFDLSDEEESLSTGVTLGESPTEEVADIAIESRFVSCGDCTFGDTLSRRSSLKR